MKKFNVIAVIAMLFIADIGFSARRGRRGGHRRGGRVHHHHHHHNGPRRPGRRVRARPILRAPGVVVRPDGRVIIRPVRAFNVRPRVRDFIRRAPRFRYRDRFGRPCPVRVPAPFYARTNPETRFLEAARNGNLAVMRRLLNRGVVRPNVRNQNGKTALHLAVKMQRHGVINFLLRRQGVHLNAQDAFGETALHVAARKGYPRIAGNLMAAGISPYIQDNQGNTAAVLADWYGHPRVADNIMGPQRR